MNTHARLACLALAWHGAAAAQHESPRRRCYFGAKLPAARMAETYGQLLRTRFPTLCAAVHPGGDFAESFASGDGQAVVDQAAPRWAPGADGAFVQEQPRCAAKRQGLEAVVKGR